MNIGASGPARTGSPRTPRVSRAEGEAYRRRDCTLGLGKGRAYARGECSAPVLWNGDARKGYIPFGHASYARHGCEIEATAGATDSRPFRRGEL